VVRRPGRAGVGAPDRGAGLGHGPGSFPVLGLHEADGFAAGLAEVGVVEEPVHGRGRNGFGHQFIEAGGVDVGADGQGAFLVGGFHDPVETLGGVAGDWQQANVIDLCGNPHRLTKSATSRSTRTPRTCSSSSSPPATRGPH